MSYSFNERHFLEKLATLVARRGHTMTSAKDGDDIVIKTTHPYSLAHTCRITVVSNGWAESESGCLNSPNDLCQRLMRDHTKPRSTRR